MKKLILFILIIVFNFPNSAQTKQVGEVKYVVKYEGESLQLNLFMQGNNLKMDKQGKDGNESFIHKGGISVVVYPAQQIYAVYDDIKDKYLDTPPPVFNTGSDEMKLTKTKEKKIILGVECEKWVLKNPAMTVELWINKNIAYDRSLADAIPEFGVNWSEIVRKEKAFPVAVKVLDDLGAVIYSFQAYEIKQGQPDKNVFVIPGNYKKAQKEPAKK